MPEKCSVEKESVLSTYQAFSPETPARVVKRYRKMIIDNFINIKQKNLFGVFFTNNMFFKFSSLGGKVLVVQLIHLAAIAEGRRFQSHQVRAFLHVLKNSKRI